MFIAQLELADGSQAAAVTTLLSASMLDISTNGYLTELVLHFGWQSLSFYESGYSETLLEEVSSPRASTAGIA